MDSFFCSLEVSVGRSDAQHLSHLPVRKMKSFIQPSNEHKIGCIPILCCSDSGYIILCCHGFRNSTGKEKQLVVPNKKSVLPYLKPLCPSGVWNWPGKAGWGHELYPVMYWQLVMWVVVPVYVSSFLMGLLCVSVSVCVCGGGDASPTLINALQVIFPHPLVYRARPLLSLAGS